MDKTLNKTLTAAMLMMLAGTIASQAQNSFPAPGSGETGTSMPAPGTGGSFNPAPSGPVGGWGGGWGNPWTTPGWNNWNGPIVVNTPLSSPTWQNAGQMNVIGVGYDVQGILRTIPMTVSYQYNGVQYDVTVVNAWDPWSRTWDYDIYQPAYNTYYYFRGTYYNFYTVLSTGTFYFNL